MNFKIKKLTTLAILPSLFLIAACASQEKTPPPQSPEAATAAGVTSTLAAERDEFVNRTEARVNELTQKAETLRSQAAQLQKPQDKKVSNAADDLDQYLKEARTHLQEVKSAAPQNWVDYRRDVQQALNRAESQYSNTLALLK